MRLLFTAAAPTLKRLLYRSAAWVTGLVLCLSCVDTPAPTQVASQQGWRGNLISDALHGGNRHFYFLPPMLPATSHTGIFDDSQLPTVEICELDSNGCLEPVLATFRFGSSPEGIRLNAADQHYIVNWKTTDYPVVVDATYRITVKVAATTLGFADVRIVQNGAAARSVSSGELIALIDGRTLPVKFRIDVGAVGVVGSEGGVVTLNDAAVALNFPAGAIDETIAVTATPVAVGSEAGPDISVIGGTLYEFQPSPTTFDEPVKLEIAFPATLPIGVKAERLALCRMVVDACVPVQGSRVNLAKRTVSADIRSFSEYGVTPFPEVLYQGETGWALHTVDGDITMPGGPHILPNGYWLPNRNAWEPSGARFVFDARSAGQVVVANADGTQSNSLGLGGYPQWSPDGSKIMFWRHAPSGSTVALAITDPSGANETRPLDPLEAQGYSGHLYWEAVRWSPDSRRIAFRSQRREPDGSETEGIFSLDLIAGEVRLMLQGHTRGDFGWSYDGTKFAAYRFYKRTGDDGYCNSPADPSRCDSSTEGLWVTDGATGENERLIMRGAAHFHWSPVSQELLVNVWPGDYIYGYWPTGTPPFGLYLVNGDGTNRRMLIENSGGGYGPYTENGIGEVVAASWSPDGRRILVDWFMGPVGNGPYIINPDGTGLQFLPPPDWNAGCCNRMTSATWRP